MENLTFSHIAWDTWNATRGGMPAIKARQQRRLDELVAFVRGKSRLVTIFYHHRSGLCIDLEKMQ